jgi:hypothetical protein
MPPQVPPNNAFQPTRCAALALQDRWHFETSADLSNPYPRNERLNARRWTVAYYTLHHSMCCILLL